MAEWESSLFGCLSSPKDCLCGLFCLPCLMSDNSANLDGNPNECLCLYPTALCKNRAQTVSKLGYGRNCFKDDCVAVCCPLCSEVQIKRELDLKAIDGYAMSSAQME